MSEQRYLCRVDHAEHEPGFGWHATLKSDDTGQFFVALPYDHKLFGEAAAWLAEGKQVYMTLKEKVHFPLGTVYCLTDDFPGVIERIEPCRERMYPENWPEPPGTVH